MAIELSPGFLDDLAGGVVRAVAKSCSDPLKEQVQSQLGLSSEFPARFRNVTTSIASDQTEGEIVQDGHDPWGMSHFNPGAVFAQGGIPAIM